MAADKPVGCSKTMASCRASAAAGAVVEAMIRQRWGGEDPIEALKAGRVPPYSDEAHSQLIERLFFSVPPPATRARTTRLRTSRRVGQGKPWLRPSQASDAGSIWAGPAIDRRAEGRSAAVTANGVTFELARSYDVSRSVFDR